MKIEFEKLEWENPIDGLQFKQYSNNGQRIRLLKFTDLYDDSLWCDRGHTGMVLEGIVDFIFDNKIERMQMGDAFQIPDGVKYRHKTKVETGKSALLFLVEKL